MVPFRAPGLLSTLCTAFYALVGMLLRGGKTVERCEFLQNSNVQLLFTAILYFYLSISFVDLRSMCVWTIPWIWFALDVTRFLRIF